MPGRDKNEITWLLLMTLRKEAARVYGWLLVLSTIIGFYLIAAYCVAVEFYVDRIRRYDGLSRMKYLMKTIEESKFINTASREMIAVITGATGRIGTEITRLLLQNNFKVVCLVRDCERGNWLNCLEYQPNLVVRCVDLSDLRKVKEVARSLEKEYPHIDLIICGAGVMLQPFMLTVDGFETHYAVNLLSHAIMINYLLPGGTEYSTRESNSCDIRVVFLSSATAHLGVFWSMLQDNSKIFNTYWNGYQAYSTTKFAVSVYVEEIDKQMQQKFARVNRRMVTAISLHPGCVASDLYKFTNTLTKAIIFRFLWRVMRNPALAAAETIALGCSDNLKGGCYYEHMVPMRMLCSTAKKQQLYQSVRNIIANVDEVQNKNHQ